MHNVVWNTSHVNVVNGFSLSQILDHISHSFIFLQVHVNLKKAGTKMEHQGIKIEFIGQIGKENIFKIFLS